MKAELFVEEKASQRSEYPAEQAVDLSVVVVVGERHANVRQLYREYAAEIQKLGYSCEFIFVVDASDRRALQLRKHLADEECPVRVVPLNRQFGEATALSVGFENARAPMIITLPAYFQVEPCEIRELITKLVSDNVDLVISRRCPRPESAFNRIKAWCFHGLVRLVTATSYHDLACGVRAMKRRVADEVALYGDLHYFFPLFAYQRGFKVSEVPVQPSRHDSGRRVYRPVGYLQRLLDLFNLFFLFNFTRKPLRFFGSVGLGLFLTGSIITGYLGAYRLFEFGGIAQRPLLILGVLLMVVGIQLFSTGLLGELVIFTQARKVKEYQVEKVLE